jgi:hypothetical protein
MNVDFNQVNTNFINEKLIEKIKEQRKLFGVSEIIQDIVPMASAKYHTDYYEIYDDTSTIQNTNNFIKVDFRGRKVLTAFSEPETRLISLVPYVITKAYEESFDFKLIKEISFYEVFPNNTNITYKNLIDKIFDYLTEMENRKITLLDFNSGERYFGISSVTKNKEIETSIFLTFVLSTRIYE